MLTLGTALPHLTRLIGAGWPWQAVILTSSVLALAAAAAIAALGDGPHLKRRDVMRAEGPHQEAPIRALDGEGLQLAELDGFAALVEAADDTR